MAANPLAPLVTRVIDGTLYSRATTPYAFDVRVHALGHGHTEAIVMPRHAWHEVDHLSAGAQADYLDCVKNPATPTRLEQLNKATCNRERSTRRARTKVRRLAKWKGLTVLLTLTYRENMLDRARMARDFDVFVKRVRRVVAGFEYICVFEQQKRGAWHAHIAVRRVLSHYMHQGSMVRSYDLLRSMWRGIVGADNGNVDVSRNKRVNRSSAKLAAYLSKYIGKSFGGNEKHVNAYSSSGRDLPPAIVERIMTADVHGAVKALFALVTEDLCAGAEVHQAFLDGGGYYLCLSPPPR